MRPMQILKTPIKILARETAAGDDGMSVSPTDKKGGAFPILLQQFRRAIGVAILRGNTNLKLGRLHYVRGMAGEAANTFRTNHSGYIYKISQKEGSGRYSVH